VDEGVHRAVARFDVGQRFGDELAGPGPPAAHVVGQLHDRTHRPIVRQPLANVMQLCNRFNKSGVNRLHQRR
jgi:hypothetical protein